METRRRPGFTLIELMIALVVTSLIATLAYSVARAGTDTSERLSRHQTGSEAVSIAFQLISDAVRHAETGVRGGTDVFTVTNMVGPNGARSSELTLLTRGLVAPLGSSDLWTLHLIATPAGLMIEASPVSSPETRIRTVLPNVSAFQVRALPRGAGAFWTDDWATPDVAPTAVELTFVTQSAARLLPPLIARVGLVRAP